MLRGRLVPLIDGGLRLGGSPVPCTMNARTVLLVPGACEPPMAVALRVERVLWNDPGTGVMRHAHAGYDIAIDAARSGGLDLPGVTG